MSSQAAEPPTSDASEAATREFLQQHEPSSETHQGRLTTDAKVLARVTDGIYRQPASALRELISNAWDADATEVHIQTDRPRFEEIVIRDDGIGMDSSTLAHVLHHIGGSAKRNQRGAELGLAHESDAGISPRGRKLIGKIGIGLFAVSQITSSFQIVTKRAGERVWNVARIDLHTHHEGSLRQDDTYDAGKFEVWTERADDPGEHGTTIFLDQIWPQTRDTLQDRETWRRYEEALGEEPHEARPKLPHFHIGAVKAKSSDTLLEAKPKLPWDGETAPNRKMNAFVSAMQGLYEGNISSNPSIKSDCDYYLRAIWELATWCPLAYVNGNPVTNADDDTEFYMLKDADPAIPLEGGKKEVAEQPFLVADGPEFPFRVIIDDIELRRPVPVGRLPLTTEAIGHSLLFLGSANVDFSNVETELSGGPLQFHAYFRWSPKVIPVENRGVIVRVGNASGMGYDPTFFGYPAAERQRMPQVTCEIFVDKGLDEALNIDRESFNYSHPHVVYLTRWIHRALRSVFNRQKSLSAAARRARRTAVLEASNDSLQEFVAKTVAARGLDSGPAAVVPVDTLDHTVERRPDYVFLRGQILGARSPGGGPGDGGTIERATAFVQVLDAYGLLDSLSPGDLSSLLADLERIVTMTENPRG